MNAETNEGFTVSLLSGESPLPADCPVDITALKDYSLEALHMQDKLEIGAIHRIEISVKCLDSKEMKSLNKQYRDQDKATNVLSFDSGMPPLTDAMGVSFKALGDIIFCPDVIANEARRQSKPPSWHWGHLMVHGTLHLCGYDHIEAQEAHDMEELEIKILSRCGITNPYQMQTHS